MGQSCQYALKGLVAGFPNLVTFSIPNQPRPNSNSLTPTLRNVVDVVPQGWRFDEALHPLPNVDGRDVTLVAQMHGSPGYAARYETAGPFNPGDPMHATTAASRVTQPGVAQAAKPPTSMVTTALTAAAAQRQQPATSATPQWSAAGLVPNATPAATNLSASRASAAVTSSAFKAPSSSFVR
jgi:hypothetical protein